MDLYLVRHADAERNASSDFDRRLTEKGEKQSKQLAEFLHTLGVRPDRILTSPLVRAVQTADALTKELQPGGGLHPNERLACGMTPDTAYEMLWDCDSDGTVVLVGHEPDFSNLASDLTGMESPYCIEMKKAACACFNVENAARGGATLRWLLPPKLIS